MAGGEGGVDASGGGVGVGEGYPRTDRMIYEVMTAVGLGIVTS